MSRNFRTAILAALAVFLPSISLLPQAPPSGTPTCPTTTADQLSGVTCQIGGLIYTFSPATLNPPLFTPDPTGSGFTLSQIPSPPANGSTIFGMLFTVQTANGAATITGMQTSINGGNVSGNGGVVAWLIADSLSVNGFSANAGCTVPTGIYPWNDCLPLQFPSPVSQILPPPIVASELSTVCS